MEWLEEVIFPVLIPPFGGASGSGGGGLGDAVRGGGEVECNVCGVGGCDGCNESGDGRVGGCDGSNSGWNCGINSEKCFNDWTMTGNFNGHLWGRSFKGECTNNSLYGEGSNRCSNNEVNDRDMVSKGEYKKRSECGREWYKGEKGGSGSDEWRSGERLSGEQSGGWKIGKWGSGEWRSEEKKSGERGHGEWGKDERRSVEEGSKRFNINEKTFFLHENHEASLVSTNVSNFNENISTSFVEPSFNLKISASTTYNNNLKLEVCKSWTLPSHSNSLPTCYSNSFLTQRQQEQECLLKQPPHNLKSLLMHNHSTHSQG